MKVLFTLILSIFTLCSTAKIDSLVQALNKHIKEGNSSKIAITYYRLGSHIHGENKFQQALDYLTHSLEYCSTDTLFADIHRKIGHVYVDSTNYKKALKHLNIADSLYKHQKNLNKETEVLNLKGLCYGLTNNLDKAIVMFQQTLLIGIELKDSTGIGLSYFNIGLAHYFKGEYKKALHNYINSLKIREKLNDTTAWITSLTTIGEVFRIKDDLNNALKYYKQAVHLIPSLKNNEIKSYVYSELALVYKLKHKYDSALIYIDTALVYSKKAGYKRGIATLTSYKASIYKLRNKTHDALSLYNNALLAYKNIGFEIGIVQANSAIAEIIIEQNRFTNAEKLLNQVEPLAQNNHLLEELVEIERLYYNLYKKQKKSSQALLHHEKYMQLKDSLHSTEKEKQIKQIETEYQVEHKEQQISLLDKENKIQKQQLNKRNILLISSAILLLLIISMFVLLIRSNKLKTELQVEQNQQKLLRSQMNPHFIYNALGAIQNFIFQNNPMDSATYISEFSALMRLVLEGSRNDFVKLSDDIKLVTAFLKLQQLRFNNAFQYNIFVDDALNTEFVKLPPMLSQPSIENAVEHGMRNLKEGEGHIKVHYTIENERLEICISDNGKGVGNVNENKKHKSLATQITKERIANIKKTYGSNIYMNSKSSNKGTKVTFKIDTNL